MPEANYPTRIDLERALEIVAARAARQRMAVESIPISTAEGRVSAEDIHAPLPLPPFANSAMDGFAVRGADLSATAESAFTLIGDVFAGASAAPAVGRGECVRVTTGAPLPPGADTVVIKENVTLDGSRVVVRAGTSAGANVRAAGEDYAQGELALAAGTPLGAAQLAVLAAFGLATITVRRQPRIALIVTGDELVPAGQPLGFGQIHDSNVVMLAALAHAAGLQIGSQCHVRDNPTVLRAALLAAASEADIIVTSGGVSAGEADYTPRVLQDIGEIHFHKVMLKPGLPTLFGQVGACLCFGLPGNPVAAAVTFRVFVRFALRTLLGVTRVPVPARARLSIAVHKRHARAEFARCSLASDADGVRWATPHPRQGSAMLRGLVETDALALLPAGAHDFAAGDVVTLWPD